ncbi:MAG: SMP-30/gluconolactonase/LRE family protein [Acidobacteriota bacterium]|nr:SMP-30/gluconolactonase/LRE family protein [Acidobacteriota bacterium]
MKSKISRFLVTLLGCSLQAASPGPFRIETIAGSSLVGDGGPALRAAFRDTESVAFDRAGNLYAADAGDHRIRKITTEGIITTVAGTGFPGFAGDNGPAARAQLNLPYGVTADPAGNLYVADLGNNRIRRISADGTITSLPGTFQAPRNVLADSQGNVYVSEFDAHRVRRIGLDGSVTLIAGTGARGRSGDSGPAILALLNYPAGLALDSQGALYIADSGNAEIRKVANGVITTVLGNGTPGISLPTQLNVPTGLAFDAFNNLYVADSGNRRIRRLSPAGSASTIATPARDLAFDSSGNLIAASGDHITKILASGVMAAFAGDGSYLFRGDAGPANESRLNLPAAVAVDSSGTLYIADSGNNRIRTVSPSGVISTATGPTGLRSPVALTLDSSANLLIADPPSALIWKLGPASLLPFAGTTFQGFTGEGFPRLASSLALPGGVAAGPTGIVYIADTANNRIRRINSAGILTTAAGNDVRGWNGDGPGTASSLDSPTALALDPSGVLYFADTGNNRIRKLTLDGQVVTVAGAQVTALALSAPRGLAFDASGNLWIADTGNHRIQLMAPDGAVTIAAGTGAPGFSGDGADARSGQFQSPAGLAADSLGNIYVADTGNNRIRILIAPPPAVTEALSTGYTAVNAASLRIGPAAPCSLLTVFGPGADTLQLSFDRSPITPVSSAPGQLTVQVPCSAAPPSTQIELMDGTTSRWRYSLAIAAAAPALFALNAGSGQAVAINPGNTLNSETNPAPRGSIMVLYATGAGIDSNPGVVVGQAAATVLFAGDAPGLPGITQLNIQLPDGVSGVQPVIVIAANIASQNRVTLAIQ